MDEQKLVIRRVFNATREELFAAWTDPVGMETWMCPGPDITTKVVEMDLRIGGALCLDMESPHGISRHTGTFCEISPPTRLAFTWRSTATNHRDTLVTIELYEQSRGTELVLTHSDLPNQATMAAYRGGWENVLKELAVVIRTIV